MSRSQIAADAPVELIDAEVGLVAGGSPGLYYHTADYTEVGGAGGNYSSSSSNKTVNNGSSNSRYGQGSYFGGAP
jgi:hypothetical protein